MIDFQRVHSDVDLVTLISQRVPLKNQGSRWLGRCPFHEDRHPSLDVSPQHHHWRCWVCGIGGDAVDWVRLTENCSTMEALRRLLDTEWPAPKVSRLLEPYPRASRLQRHQAYTALLEAAGLSDRHHEALRARGLSDRAIGAAGYATLPPGRRRPLLTAMHDAVPDLRGIAGVSHRPDRDRWSLLGASGLLVPVRDRFGQVQACQIRTDRGSSRYIWLTSAPHEPYVRWTGTSPGTPFHVAGHQYIRRWATWWVTEGPLKADVAAFFLQYPVIGIPGVALWPRVGKALSQWHPASVVLAFDHDVNPETRRRVMNAQEQLGSLLFEAGMRVHVAYWEDGPKGIDDALAAHVKVHIRRWRSEATPEETVPERGDLPASHKITVG